MKQSGYLKRQADVQDRLLQIGTEVGQQQVFDALALALRDPAVMGAKGVLGPAKVKRAIEEAPTVDAVEVVRCKDCKYSHNDPLLLCDALASYVCAEWFCWNGKRRNEEDGKSKLD